MSQFTIRPATGADVPAIRAIYADAVLHGTASYELDPPDEREMAARLEAVLARGCPYLVAEAPGGAILGYAYASAFRDRPAYRWTVENSVYVAPEAKGRGVGRALLARLVEVCAALGFRQMIAVIGGADHAPSIRLHEQLGFRRIGVVERTGFKFGRWIDTVLMQMPLGEGATTLPDEGTYPGTLYRR